MGWDGGGDFTSEMYGTAVSSTLLFCSSIDSLCFCGWLMIVQDEMGILVKVYWWDRTGDGGILPYVVFQVKKQGGRGGVLFD